MKRNILLANEVPIRDPFILLHEENYYLYGTTRDPWGKSADGFDTWMSEDLIHWSYAGEVYKKVDNAEWNQYHFWAPEVYFRNGKFYMFYTSKSDRTRRAVGVAVSNSPTGPFIDSLHNPLTPSEWECLDGHVYTDDQGNNYLFYVHEWIQCGTGEMYIQPLSNNLMSLQGTPQLLFRSRDAKWVTSRRKGDVVDGPFLLRHNSKYYLMWTSFSEKGYCTGYAVSDSLFGPYRQSEEPIINDDGGHSMCFVGKEGQLYSCYHSPNKNPNERLVIKKLIFSPDGSLKLLD